MTDLPTIQMEAKKDGLQQTQDGLWKVTLRVHANDMAEEFVMAAMGQRFQVVMVAIGDHEEPKAIKPKRTWEELTPAEQAGIRCAEPEFQSWLKEWKPGSWRNRLEQFAFSAEHVAADMVRTYCTVLSRAGLNTSEEAATKWRELDQRYMEETGRMAKRMG